MSNRTFSIKKDREISPLEARVGSIKRQLTNTLRKRWNGEEKRALPSTLQVPLSAMPRNRGRRGEPNEEASGTEESYVNGLGGNNSNNRAAVFGEDADDMGHDHINNNPSDGKPRQHRGASSSQHKYKQGLGPWTEAVAEATRSMGATHKAINDLQSRFELHLNDLKMMEETKDKLAHLEEECREKEDEIRKQEGTINTLVKVNSNIQEKIKHERENIEQERKMLDQERAKLDKRVNAAMAEERHKLRSEFDILITQHGQSHDKRKKELEDEFRAQREENNRRLTLLETENSQLLTKMEEQKNTIGDLKKQLEKTTEQCDVLERAKDSVKKDKLAIERELEMMKREFALSPKSKEYFKQRFAEVYSVIEAISLKYFSDIDGEDLEKVHEELATKDACFASVPVEDTDDSYSLRVAHSQRIISSAICEYIWKPFRSEFTLSHPEFDALLAKMSDELEKSGQGGRVANVWTALTMRALQSMPADSIPSQASEDKQTVHPNIPVRAEGVVTKVFSILSSLISPSQHEGLRISLLELAKLAIDIWNDAQTGELKVIISSSLDPAHREEWRSQRFDPASPSDSYSNIGSDIESKTHLQIYTLFPRVVTLEAAGPVKHEANLPGSWPSESDQGHRRIETCIHAGVGLPEWSPLVVRGKEEQEQRSEYLSKVIETAKKQLHSNRRNTGHGRTDSMGSVASASSSPSEQWKMGSVMKITEK